jgi:hypothetical protein
MNKVLNIILISLFSLTFISCGEEKEESATDTTAPVIAEVTAVTTPTSDTTPDYIFSSDEAGTISYGGSCSSSTTSAVSGNNTITLVSLSEGTYSDCTITVTDSSGNSVTLNISSFTVFIYKFVAVGASGTILTSTDGTTWTSRTSGTSESLIEITYGNGTYVAVGTSGTILTSKDGITWTTAASGLTNNGTTVGLYGVTYGNNTYVAVGNANYGNGAVFTSTNGSDWSFRNSGSSASFFDVTYANSIFTASGYGGSIIYSSDATTWTSSDNVTSNKLNGVAYGSGIYLGVGDNYTITSSTDGTSWGNLGASGNIPINDIIYANSNFYLVLGYGYLGICQNCSTSSFNINTSNIGISDDLYGIVYGNSTYIIVGSSGTILTSTNGTTWTSRTSGASNNLYGVIYSQ